MATPMPAPYIRAFEQLGFGMFIHWGLYSQLEKGEWAMFQRKIPKETYQELKSTFTADKFDAEKIVLTAKSAGMKYIVLTSRHHEGFSLYDTCGLNDYDAPHSPAKRDLVREFVDACNKYEIIPFLYHTTLDWYNEDYEKDFPKYLEYLNQSVELLCTNYGKIGGLWFDGNWNKPNADWQEDKLYATIRKHQPEAMIINNSGLSALGKVGHRELDSVTFERGQAEPLNREGAKKYVAVEMCETLNEHWGISKGDFKYKSIPELIEILCACRKVGANLLLNVGPTGMGEILPLQEQIVLMLGEWTKLYGKALYTPVPSSVKGTDKNFVLEDDENYYFFIHDLNVWGNPNVTIGISENSPRTFWNLYETIEQVYWLDDKQELDFVGDKKSGIFSFHAIGYNYGDNTVVRVAVGKKKK